MEPQWLTFGKRLQAIASTGIHYSRDEFDRERYEEIAQIANEMLATLGNVPVERIEGWFRISREATRHRKLMFAAR
jgi:hypothetical protein